MSRRKRRKNRQNGKAKQQPQTPQSHDPAPAETEVQASVDRFVYVKEIAEYLGVGDAAVRQWRRQGKIKLRKLFGTTGKYGMPESQLIKFINGEGGDS